MSKTPSDSLFRLIRSMSKSEKRHFKLYSSRHSVEENNYQKLFDAIDRQKNYDEEFILKKFSKETFTNRFPITKKRLYETVLRSLDAFHSQSSFHWLDGRIVFFSGPMSSAETVRRSWRTLGRTRNSGRSRAGYNSGRPRRSSNEASGNSVICSWK